MNLPTILILALIGIALFAALRSMKKHPSGCSGHCSGCPVQCKSEKHRMKFNSSASYNELMNKFYRFQDENIILSNVSERIQQCKSFADIADEMRKDDLMYAMTCVIKSECIDESVNPEEKIQMRFRNKMFVLYDSDDIDLKKSVGEKTFMKSLALRQIRR